MEKSQPQGEEGKLPIGYKFIPLGDEKPFPANIFSFRHYGGLKVLSIILFLFAAINFSKTVYLISFNRGYFVEAATDEIANRGWIKKGYYGFVNTVWQNTPLETKVIIDSQHAMFWAVTKDLLLLSFAWLFVWLCFDWRNTRYLVFAIASLGCGILFNFMPGHMIDNEIPIVGEAETSAVEIVSTGMGALALAEHLKRRRSQEMINRLIQSNPQAAITIALEEYGIAIEKNQNPKNDAVLDSANHAEIIPPNLN
ncbi:MAG: hypothetical protein ABI254_11650 [Chthoniobacterales bacterium]